MVSHLLTIINTGLQQHTETVLSAHRYGVVARLG